MTLNKRMGAAFAVFLCGLLLLAKFAFESGYQVGSDIATRDNSHSADGTSAR